MKPYEIIVDVKNLRNYMTKKVEAKQSDTNSRTVQATICDDGIPLKLTGNTISFYAKKPDGTKIFNVTKIIDAENGLVEFKLTTQTLAVEGEVKCELTIFDETEGVILSTAIFNISVIETIRDDNAIESSNEFNQIIQVLNRLSEIEAHEMERISNEEARVLAEQQRKQNESERITNENTRQQSENTRKDNEITRKQNEAQRESNEDTRKENESKRGLSEDERVANEKIRIQNEIYRQNFNPDNYVKTIEKGAIDGVAPLDSNGLVPTTHIPTEYATKDYAKSYTDEQITLVTETGIPKLNVYKYSFADQPIGTTELEIPLNTFDKTTDHVIIKIGGVQREEGDHYTITAPVKDVDGNVTQLGKVTLIEPLTQVSKIYMEVWKNIPVGNSGSVSGIVIAPGTLPQDRLVGDLATFNPNMNFDVIVDSGSNSNGEYIRYESGLQVCYRLFNSSLKPTNQTGSIYTSNTDILSFPASFLEIPVVILSTVFSGRWAEVTGTPTLTDFKFQVLSAVSSESQGNVFVYAIGKWK